MRVDLLTNTILLLETMAPTPERIETDIVIIGGGMSGLSAAIALSESSQVRCVLVDKSHVLGGSSKL